MGTEQANRGIHDRSLRRALGEAKTRVLLRGFYTPKGWWALIMNALVIRRNMRHRANDTVRGFKRLLEGDPSRERNRAEPDAPPDRGGQ